MIKHGNEIVNSTLFKVESKECRVHLYKFGLIAYKLSNTFHVHKILIVSLGFPLLFVFFPSFSPFNYFFFCLSFCAGHSNSLSNLCFNLLGLFVQSLLSLARSLTPYSTRTVGNSWASLNIFLSFTILENLKGEHTALLCMMVNILYAIWQ